MTGTNPMKKQMTFLSIGEIVWDVYGDKATLGGAPLNLAVHIAMNGENSALVSAVGDDVLGRTAIECAERFSVDTRYISVLKDVETAKCTVTDGENGFPSYTLDCNASFDRTEFPCVNGYADVVCFGTLALRYENNRRVIERILKEVPHGEVFCDINLRAPYYSKMTVEYCFSAATLMKVSSEEFPEVCRCLSEDECDIAEAAERLSDIYKNIKLFIVTLGADGAMCYDSRGGKWYRCGAKAVDVVSTVGAGDSFSAAFLVRYMRGESISDCLEYASKISAAVCSCEAAFSEKMLEMNWH